jgi:hypothetical protein
MSEPDSISEVAKATQEVAKTAGKAIEAAREAGGFLAEFIKEPLREQVGIWTDNLRHKRWENQLALQEKALAKISALGSKFQFRQIPMRLGVPLLEAASLADEPELQEVWSNLIVTFANENSEIGPERSFVSVLGELSPLEAVILEKIYAVAGGETGGVLTSQLPEMATRQLISTATAESPSKNVALALSNLTRLGCLTPGATWGGGESLGIVFPSTLGRELVRACTLSA